jgi:hypothetical protein
MWRYFGGFDQLRKDGDVILFSKSFSVVILKVVVVVVVTFCVY